MMVPERSEGGMTGLLYFEDVKVGDTERFGRYEVTREEIIEYARQFDPQPFHLDEEAGKASPFGGLIASGWHTGAMLIRMLNDHSIPRAATSGALGFDDLKWVKPVRPGDILSVETRVLDKAESRSRPEIGVVKVESRVLNQAGELKMSLVSIVLYRRRR
jgi:acyl dehydratase